MPYSVIYADPPWKFKTYSQKGLGRSAEAWYDCMSLDEIKALPVQSWSNSDCVLFLWVTDPFLFKSKEVIEAWGFEYKTVGFYWTKPNFMGTGYWTRANPEQCLLATKGNPKPQAHDVRRWITSARREHSKKPDEIYSHIERLCLGPYLELFARQPWPGWDSLGQELDSGPGKRRWKSNSGPEKKTEPQKVLSVTDFLKE